MWAWPWKGGFSGLTGDVFLHAAGEERWRNPPSVPHAAPDGGEAGRGAVTRIKTNLTHSGTSACKFVNFLAPRVTVLVCLCSVLVPVIRGFGDACEVITQHCRASRLLILVSRVVARNYERRRENLVVCEE